MATDQTEPEGAGAAADPQAGAEREAGAEPEQAAEVGEDLVEDIKGMVDAMAGRPEAAELAAKLGYIVDLLILRGHLKPGHRRLLNKVRADRSSVVLAVFPDKRKVVGPDIDCASYIHLCKARCCSYNVVMAPQDVLEGKLRWELYEPYRLLRDKTTGYCRYMKADTGCSVYEDRPATCRLYDCRDDPRVWLDWENKIPAPMDVGTEHGVVPLGEWPARDVIPADDDEKL
jgi:hypothetical protein